MILKFDEHNLLLEKKIDNSNIDDILIIGINRKDTDIIEFAIKKGAT